MSSIYKNFFIIITNPAQRFNLQDNQGNTYQSSYTGVEDSACFWKEKSIYLSIEDTLNGYFETSNGEILRLDYENFPERHRHLTKFVYMIAPIGTPLNEANREPSISLMKTVFNSDSLNIEDVIKYEHKTRGKFHPEIKNRL